MRISSRLAIGLAVTSLAISVPSAFAQKIEASVLYRQDSDNRYIAVVPGYSGPDADISGACMLDPDPANCPAADSASQRREVYFMLVGTTLTLRLPDGRVAVVNCVNRHSAKGNYVNRRSCGMPMVEHVDAKFIGKSAKLKWQVGTDGKKTESESYKVVAMLEKRTESARF
jgi:hypothetical protein